MTKKDVIPIIPETSKRNVVSEVLRKPSGITEKTV